jgi:WD40 repeat protein
LKLFLRGFIEKAIPPVKPRRNPALVFSTDGEEIISVGGFYSDAVIVWDLTTFQPRVRLSKGDGNIVDTVACSYDGRIVAAGREDGTIILWDLKREAPLGLPLVHATEGITCLSFSPVEPLLASGGYDNTIVLWDVATGKLVKRLQTNHTRNISRLAFSPTGVFLAAVGNSSSNDRQNDDITVIWELVTDRSIEPLEGMGMTFSPSDEVLALVGKGVEGVAMWEVEAQSVKQVLTIPEPELIESLSISRDGKTVVAGKNKFVLLWDVVNNQPFKEPFHAHQHYVDTVAISPDGLTVASIGYDDAIILWSAAEPPSLGTLFAREVGFAEIKFSPDGKRLMSVASRKNQSEIWAEGDSSARRFEDGRVLLWDVATARIVRSYDIGGCVPTTGIVSHRHR